MSISNLSLQGYSCILFQDDVKSKEINRGALLVPYNGDKSIMIDRYDGRGHLSDLQSHGGPFSELPLSHDEWEIEQSCNYERYYDLYHSNQSDEFKSSPQQLGEMDHNNDQSRYSAIGFDYDRVPDETRTTDNVVIDKEVEDSTNDTPFICPPNLRLLPGMITPATEREAAIIEQTAKFVADKGPQLEILIKTKQANNPKFVFLNYDDRLHPFYRHITNLIKTAQYVPGKRHISHLVESGGTQSQMDSMPLPVVPKIDISSTPYGKLIERFKLSQEKKNKLDQEKATKAIESELNSNEQCVQHNVDNSSHKTNDNLDSASLKSLFEQRSPSPASVELAEARHKMYEDLYQQYYPYYYQYYYDIYGTSESSDNIVEMARSYAASSAASWIQSNMPPDPNIQIEENQDTVIVKMAEYVARNGIEFEQMMLARNSERFAFLLPGHANHYKYKKCLDKELNKSSSTRRSPSPSVLPEQTIASIVDSYGLSPPHSSSCPISFKMATKQKSIAVLPNNLNENCVQLEDFDDDFDFTDKLQSKNENGAARTTTKNGRISRFSPANPKNVMAVAHFKNDLQIQRKRKAAEFLASRMLCDKMSKSDETTTNTQLSL